MPHTRTGQAQHIRPEQWTAEAMNGTVDVTGGEWGSSARIPLGEGGSWHCRKVASTTFLPLTKGAGIDLNQAGGKTFHGRSRSGSPCALDYRS
jgi:hypothetical protein